tara:strand:- start:65 stop:385 length:321 start_codon:yes stop_codon:yes gene_type:complete
VDQQQVQQRVVEKEAGLRLVHLLQEHLQVVKAVQEGPFQVSVLELLQPFLLLQVAAALADQVLEVPRAPHQRAQQARPVSTSQGSVVRQALVAFLAELEVLQPSVA